MPTTPPLAPPAPALRSPAHEAYRITEIQQQILHSLGRKDLVSFMGVERGCFAEVVKVLYNEIEQRIVKQMESSTARQRTYLAAITVIRAERVHLEPDQWDQLYPRRYGPSEYTSWLEREQRADPPGAYSPELFGFVVPPLLAKCPNLRRINFGCRGFGSSSWTVTFNRSASEASPITPDDSDEQDRVAEIDYNRVLPFPEDVPDAAVSSVESCDSEYASDDDVLPCPLGSGLSTSSSEGSSEAEIADSAGRDDDGQLGHIVYNQMAKFSVELAPSIPLTPKSPTPPPGYTIHVQFDFLPLNLRGMREVHAGWAEALTRDRIFDRCRAVTLDLLPATLGQLEALYERQSASGGSDCIEMISCPRVAPYTLKQFESFARVASTSLVSLNIASQGNAIPISQLSALNVITRHHLPHLRELHVCVDLTAAEGRAMLSPTILEPGGRLSTFGILVAKQPSLGDLDLLRLISPMVTSIAEVGVSWSDEAWIQERHTAAFRYLRQQPAHRRIHLGTVDFSKLGISERTIFELEYDDDGRPLSRVDSETARWVEIANDLTPREVLVDFTEVLDEVATAAAQLRESTVSGTPLETLEKMRGFLDSIDEIDEAANRLMAIARERRQMAWDVQAMIRVLETVEKDEE